MNTQETELGSGRRHTYLLHETAARKAIVGLARLLFRFVMTLQVDGLENLPSEGACILVANHVTNLDVFPLQLSVPRPIFFMAKAELFSNAFLGWLAREVGAFPVRRGASDLWAMEHARRVLENSLILGMFPEGTRSRSRGLSVARTGAARLAIERNVPLIPAGVEGTGSFLHGFPHRNPVRVSLSRPIFPQPDDDPLSLTERVMFALAASLPQELRGVYASEPPGF